MDNHISIGIVDKRIELFTWSIKDRGNEMFMYQVTSYKLLVGRRMDQIEKGDANRWSPLTTCYCEVLVHANYPYS